MGAIDGFTAGCDAKPAQLTCSVRVPATSGPTPRPPTSGPDSNPQEDHSLTEQRPQQQQQHQLEQNQQQEHNKRQQAKTLRHADVDKLPGQSNSNTMVLNAAAGRLAMPAGSTRAADGQAGGPGDLQRKGADAVGVDHDVGVGLADVAEPAAQGCDHSSLAPAHTAVKMTAKADRMLESSVQRAAAVARATHGGPPDVGPCGVKPALCQSDGLPRAARPSGGPVRDVEGEPRLAGGDPPRPHGSHEEDAGDDERGKGSKRLGDGARADGEQRPRGANKVQRMHTLDDGQQVPHRRTPSTTPSNNGCGGRDGEEYGVQVRRGRHKGLICSHRGCSKFARLTSCGLRKYCINHMRQQGYTPKAYESQHPQPLYSVQGGSTAGDGGTRHGGSCGRTSPVRLPYGAVHHDLGQHLGLSLTTQCQVLPGRMPGQDEDELYNRCSTAGRESEAYEQYRWCDRTIIAPDAFARPDAAAEQGMRGAAGSTRGSHTQTSPQGGAPQAPPAAAPPTAASLVCPLIMRDATGIRSIHENPPTHHQGPHTRRCTTGGQQLELGDKAPQVAAAAKAAASEDAPSWDPGVVKYGAALVHHPALPFLSRFEYDNTASGNHHHYPGSVAGESGFRRSAVSEAVELSARHTHGHLMVLAHTPTAMHEDPGSCRALFGVPSGLQQPRQEAAAQQLGPQSIRALDFSVGGGGRHGGNCALTVAVSEASQARGAADPSPAGGKAEGGATVAHCGVGSARVPVVVATRPLAVGVADMAAVAVGGHVTAAGVATAAAAGLRQPLSQAYGWTSAPSQPPSESQTFKQHPTKRSRVEDSDQYATPPSDDGPYFSTNAGEAGKCTSSVRERASEAGKSGTLPGAHGTVVEVAGNNTHPASTHTRKDVNVCERDGGKAAEAAAHYVRVVSWAHGSYEKAGFHDGVGNGSLVTADDQIAVECVRTRLTEVIGSTVAAVATIPPRRAGSDTGNNAAATPIPTALSAHHRGAAAPAPGLEDSGDMQLALRLLNVDSSLLPAVLTLLKSASLLGGRLPLIVIQPANGAPGTLLPEPPPEGSMRTLYQLANGRIVCGETAAVAAAGSPTSRPLLEASAAGLMSHAPSTSGTGGNTSGGKLNMPQAVSYELENALQQLMAAHRAGSGPDEMGAGGRDRAGTVGTGGQQTRQKQQQLLNLDVRVDATVDGIQNGSRGSRRVREGAENAPSEPPGQAQTGILADDDCLDAGARAFSSGGRQRHFELDRGADRRPHLHPHYQQQQYEQEYQQQEQQHQQSQTHNPMLAALKVLQAAGDAAQLATAGAGQKASPPAPPPPGPQGLPGPALSETLSTGVCLSEQRHHRAITRELPMMSTQAARPYTRHHSPPPPSDTRSSGYPETTGAAPHARDGYEDAAAGGALNGAAVAVNRPDASIGRQSHQHEAAGAPLERYSHPPRAVADAGIAGMSHFEPPRETKDDILIRAALQHIQKLQQQQQQQRGGSHGVSLAGDRSGGLSGASPRNAWPSFDRPSDTSSAPSDAAACLDGSVAGRRATGIRSDDISRGDVLLEPPRAAGPTQRSMPCKEGPLSSFLEWKSASSEEAADITLEDARRPAPLLSAPGQGAGRVPLMVLLSGIPSHGSRGRAHSLSKGLDMQRWNEEGVSTDAHAPVRSDAAFDVEPSRCHKPAAMKTSLPPPPRPPPQQPKQQPTHAATTSSNSGGREVLGGRLVDNIPQDGACKEIHDAQQAMMQATPARLADTEQGSLWGQNPAGAHVLQPAALGATERPVAQPHLRLVMAPGGGVAMINDEVFGWSEASTGSLGKAQHLSYTSARHQEDEEVPGPGLDATRQGRPQQQHTSPPLVLRGHPRAPHQHHHQWHLWQGDWSEGRHAFRPAAQLVLRPSGQAEMKPLRPHPPLSQMRSAAQCDQPLEPVFEGHEYDVGGYAGSEDLDEQYAALVLSQLGAEIRQKAVREVFQGVREGEA